MPCRSLLAAAIAVLFCACGAEAADPVPLIFDTDMGNDVDDALALAVIHALQSRGEARLLAVTITKDSKSAGPYVDLINTFYGRADIPIGVVRVGPTQNDSSMIRIPAERLNRDGSFVYPHTLTDGGASRTQASAMTGLATVAVRRDGR